MMTGSSDIIAGTSSNNKQDLSDREDELIHREDPLSPEVVSFFKERPTTCFRIYSKILNA